MSFRGHPKMSRDYVDRMLYVNPCKMLYRLTKEVREYCIDATMLCDTGCTWERMFTDRVTSYGWYEWRTIDSSIAHRGLRDVWAEEEDRFGHINELNIARDDKDIEDKEAGGRERSHSRPRRY